MEKTLNKEQPIFIVGMPRSGTTLLTSMLSAHPAIAIAPAETHFLNNFIKLYPHLDVSSPKDFEFLWGEFVKSERFSYLDIDPEATLARILAMGTSDYKTLFTGVLQEYATKMKKPRWGEKTPDHFLHLNVLLEWYPQARIFWMLRDPRSVVASLLDVPWAGSYIEGLAGRWRYSIRNLEKWSSDERVRVIKYEALVAEPEPILIQACDFLNEEYTPAMLDRSNDTRRIVNRSGWSQTHNQTVMQPVTTKNVDKWQSSLSPFQVAVIEHTTKNEMLKYGYQPVTKGLSLWQKVLRKGINFREKTWREIDSKLSQSPIWKQVVVRTK